MSFDIIVKKLGSHLIHFVFFFEFSLFNETIYELGVLDFQSLKKKSHLVPLF